MKDVRHQESDREIQRRIHDPLAQFGQVLHQGSCLAVPPRSVTATRAFPIASYGINHSGLLPPLREQDLSPRPNPLPASPSTGPASPTTRPSLAHNGTSLSHRRLHFCLQLRRRICRRVCHLSPARCGHRLARPEGGIIRGTSSSGRASASATAVTPLVDSIAFATAGVALTDSCVNCFRCSSSFFRRSASSESRNSSSIWYFEIVRSLAEIHTSACQSASQSAAAGAAQTPPAPTPSESANPPSRGCPAQSVDEFP